MTNLVEIRFPSCDRLFVICVEGSEEHTPFTTLGNMPLDFSYGTAVETFVSESLEAPVASLTHIINCAIASNTGEPG